MSEHHKNFYRELQIFAQRIRRRLKVQKGEVGGNTASNAAKQLKKQKTSRELWSFCVWVIMKYAALCSLGMAQNQPTRAAHTVTYAHTAQSNKHDRSRAFEGKKNIHSAHTAPYSAWWLCDEAGGEEWIIVEGWKSKEEIEIYHTGTAFHQLSPHA